MMEQTRKMMMRLRRPGAKLAGFGHNFLRFYVRCKRTFSGDGGLVHPTGFSSLLSFPCDASLRSTHAIDEL